MAKENLIAKFSDLLKEAVVNKLKSEIETLYRDLGKLKDQLGIARGDALNMPDTLEDELQKYKSKYLCCIKYKSDLQEQIKEAKTQIQRDEEEYGSEESSSEDDE